MCPQFVALNNTIKVKMIYGRELFRIIRTSCILHTIFLSRFLSKSKVQGTFFHLQIYVMGNVYIVGNLNR